MGADTGRNGQDPSTYCDECHKRITTTESGNEVGHDDNCSWNPKNS